MSEKFNIHLNWLDKGHNFTYNEYSREYIISGADKPDLIGTAAPTYKGLLEHYNPEDLLVASIASCHMLSYLALAANSNVVVINYTDDAEGVLGKEGMTMKFQEITLRPKITISSASDPEKALALHDKAHKVCFIANSVNFPVHVTAEIVKQ